MKDTKDAKKDLKDKIVSAIRDTEWSWEEAWEIFREAEFAYEKTYLKKRGSQKQFGYDGYSGYGGSYYGGVDYGVGADVGVNSTGISKDFKGITKQVKENASEDERILKDLKKKHKSLDNKS